MQEQTIAIDCGSEVGTVKPIHGTNIGPVYLQGSYDASEYFKEAGFPSVRLHDCPYVCFDVVDVPCIFPLFHLAPDDPSNYTFRATDSYLQSIVDCGCGIVYRLGVSIRKRPEFSLATDPPEDFSKWADVCVQIIRHYNDGWADGFHHGIRYWEIWNEADNGPTQWNGPYDQFIDFFVTAAKRIKTACPDILIGGPAFNGSFVHSRDKLHTFLPRLAEADCPLDFLSWHAYNSHPMQLVEAANDVRSILDSYGFDHTESHCNEWNLAPIPSFKEMRRTPEAQTAFFAYKDGPVGATIAASSLIALQDAPIDMTNYYSAMTFNYGMFDLCAQPKKPFFAFPAFNEMVNTFHHRVAVTGHEPDHGLAVLAGFNATKDAIGILAVNHDSDTSEWTLELKDMPWAAATLDVRVVDKDHDLDPCDTAAKLRGATLSLHLPRHSMLIVRIVPDKDQWY